MKFEDYKRKVGLYLLGYMDANEAITLMERKVDAVWGAWQDGLPVAKIGEWLR